MAQIVQAGAATPQDIRNYGVKSEGIRLANGAVIKSAIDQQRYNLAQELARTRRDTVKQITISYLATNATNTVVVGNALGLSADVNVAQTATYQNSGAAAGAAGQTTAFEKAINSYPFRFVGMKVDVSDVANFSATWTELINDYDVNCTKPFNEKMDLGQNIFSEAPTTRLIPVQGEFNGFWGLKGSNMANASTVKFTFYVVDIKRAW